MAKLLRRSAVVVFPLSLLAVACGSRGPLDIDVLQFGADAGDQGADATAGDASDDTSPTDGPPDTGTPPRDAGRDSGRGLGFDSGVPVVNCAGCIFTSCGTLVVACIQNPTCQSTLTCVTQKCLTGGTPSPQCVLTCSNGDPTALIDIFKIFQCITSTCGPDCTSLLGGGGGRPDAGRGQPDAGRPLPRQHIVNEAFSAWPELCSPETLEDETE